jgi:hypothetical protein
MIFKKVNVLIEMKKYNNNQHSHLTVISNNSVLFSSNNLIIWNGWAIYLIE